MRGLIYRELYLGRKVYITGILTVVLFIFFGTLIRLSMLYGNLADLEEETYYTIDLMSYYVFSYFPVALLFATFAGDGGVSISDYKSKWCLFTYSLPITEQQLAKVKFTIKVGFMLLSFLFGIGNLALFAALGGRTVDGNSMKILLIIMMFVSVVSAVVTPLTLKYKSEKAVYLRMGIVAFLLYIGLGLSLGKWMMNFQKEHPLMMPDDIVDTIMEWLARWRDILAVLSPFVTIIVLFLGYLLTVRQLKKREVM